jgi:hypothetical protein
MKWAETTKSENRAENASNAGQRAVAKASEASTAIWR